MTKREAAEAAGLAPTYFSLVSSPGSALYKPEVKELMDEVDQQIHDKTVSLSAIVQSIGRKAIERQYELMRESKNEAIVLKATQDFLDRNPETSKIHKHQVSSFSVSSEDSRILAEALVKTAEARLAGRDAQVGDFVRIPVEDQSNAIPGSLEPEVRSLDARHPEGATGHIGDASASIPNLSEGTPEVGPAPQEPEAEGPIVMLP